MQSVQQDSLEILNLIKKEKTLSQAGEHLCQALVRRHCAEGIRQTIGTASSG